MAPMFHIHDLTRKNSRTHGRWRITRAMLTKAWRDTTATRGWLHLVGQVPRAAEPDPDRGQARHR